MLTVHAPTVANAVKILVPLALVIWSLSYFGFSRAQYELVRTFQSEKAVFVADFLEHEIDGAFDGTGLAKLCAAKTWTNGLMMSCAPPAGGVAVVRNSQLHCIRMAIEMGAEVILPEIIPRDNRDIRKVAPSSNGPHRGVPLDYMFDVPHLVELLSTHCPQMKVHASLNELWDVPGLLDPVNFKYSDNGVPIENGSVLVEPHVWAERMAALVELKRPSATRRYPMRIHLEVPAQYAWPASADLPEVAQHFGRLLRVRQDARRLAAAVLFQLSRRFRLKLDPRKGHHPETFAGVHLRTEADIAGDAQFPAYVTQAAYYLNYLVEEKSPVAYLATGATPENITAFSDRAQDFNITVVTKQDLLDGTERAELAALSWDQRALVDYEVMLRAGLVTGTSVSGFGWNLAIRRAYAFGHGPGEVATVESPNLQWKDDYTALWGGQNARSNALRVTTWP